MIADIRSAGKERCYSKNDRRLDKNQSCSDSSDADPLIGTTLAGRYEIISRIAEGGWGNVYKAKHVSLGIDVAVKVIHKHLANAEGMRRFELEAVVLHRLNSPYIVRIMDYCSRPPYPFIVMEYFEGLSLDRQLECNQFLSTELAVDFFEQAANGLNSAERLGLVHRDLKPSNILYRIINGKAELKIIDFGIAKLADETVDKLTATGEILGSPPYMAPEQWCGQVDQRSDIYSLGCIMYEAVSGKRPFNALKTIDYLDQHLNTIPPRFAVASPQIRTPEGLEMVIRKCLQKNPSDRYQSYECLRADLKKVRDGRKLLLWLPDDRRKELLVAVVLTWILAVTSIFFLVRDPIVSYIVDSLNAKAKLEFDAGKDRDALQILRRSNELSAVLPKQDSRKLQAMQMLSLMLKLNGQMNEAENLDKTLAEVQAVQDTLGKAAELSAKKKPHINEMLMPNRFHADAMDYIEASPEKVWQEIGRFGDLSWHPCVQSCTIDKSGALRKSVLRDPQLLKESDLATKPGNTRQEKCVITEKLLGSGKQSMCFQIVSGLPVHPVEIIKVDPVPGYPNLSAVSMSANFFEPGLDPSKAKLYSEQMLDHFAEGLKSLQKRHSKP